jgi:predicted AlkP superfamily phosphohydrolase/phosphomutase
LLKPFADWTEKIPLVANKQFYYMAEYHDNEQLIIQEDFMEFILQHYKVSKDWLDFLKYAIK